jgi:RNA polymerase-binding transcription factor DksA
MPTAKKAAAKKSAAAPAKPSTAKAATRKAAPVKRTSTRADGGAATTRRTTSATGDKAAAPAPPPPKKAAAPAPVRAATPAFDDKFLAAQRVLLLEERATYLRQAETLQAEADSLAELREPGDVQFDEESGEGDTLAVERERDLALSARARQEVEEIDRALVKIDQGTYGICEVSGEPIPRARLQAIPQARERVEYKVGGFGRR